MSNYEATRYDFDGQYLQDVEGVNTGIIVPWSSGSVPSGFLECDGSAVSRTTYAALFAVVGTNYGVGDGSTTFNVPNLNDRIPVHKSPTKTQFTTGGSDTTPVSGSITGVSIGATAITNPTMAAHVHSLYGGGRVATPTPSAGNQTYTVRAPGSWSSAGGDDAHTHSGSGTFTGDAASVVQPYLTTKYIIKT